MMASGICSRVDRSETATSHEVSSARENGIFCMLVWKMFA